MTTLRSVSLPVFGAGSVGAGLYLYMSRVSDGYGAASLEDAVWVYGGAGAVLILLVAWLRFGEPQSPGGSEAAGCRSTLLWVLAFALLFRLLGVLTFPVLEDDFYRYLWDGRMFVESGSPYGPAPADFFASPNLSQRFETILDGINHPGLPTIYGPTLQLVFGLSYQIAPGALWPVQCLFALADVAVLLTLLRFVPLGSRPHLICWLLYAWSPLLIKEFATTAHPDILGVLFVLVAFFLFQGESQEKKQVTKNTIRLLLIGFLLALAVGVKPFALVVAPFLIRFRVQAMAGFALGILLITLPFVGFDLFSDVEAALGVWLPEGLRAMGQGWFFNAGLYEFGYWLGIRDLVLLQRIALGLFAAVWTLAWISAMVGTGSRSKKSAAPAFLSTAQSSTAPVVLVLLGLFMFVLPALNPWYLVWWLPFAVIVPCITPWVASVAVLLSYLSGINVSSGATLDSFGALYTVPGWVLAIEFGSIGLALILDIRRVGRKWVFRRQTG